MHAVHPLATRIVVCDYGSGLNDELRDTGILSERTQFDCATDRPIFNIYFYNVSTVSQKYDESVRAYRHSIKK